MPGRRIDRGLLALRLASQGSAVDYAREVVSSTPEKSAAPPDVDLTADIWTSIVVQFVTRLEGYAAGERDSLAMTRREIRDAVRMLPGYSSGFVAHALGEPVDRVRETRAVLGVDPDTGLSKPKPLTAPAPFQLDSYADGLSDGYEWSFDGWEDVYTPEAVYGVELDDNDVPEHGRWTAREGAGISARRYYEDRAAPKHAKDATYPKLGYIVDTAGNKQALDGDPVRDWLRENDPCESAEGVAQEVDAALVAEGLSLEQARRAFRKSGGRPTAELTHLRARVAAALVDIWEDDRRRDFMAVALDCHRTTLWGLMSKPQHGSSI
jgi:hypothetical protein